MAYPPLHDRNIDYARVLEEFHWEKKRLTEANILTSMDEIMAIAVMDWLVDICPTKIDGWEGAHMLASTVAKAGLYTRKFAGGRFESESNALAAMVNKMNQQIARPLNMKYGIPSPVIPARKLLQVYPLNRIAR